MKTMWIWLFLILISMSSTCQAKSKYDKGFGYELSNKEVRQMDNITANFPQVVKQMIIKCKNGDQAACGTLNDNIYNNPDMLNKLAMHYAKNGGQDVLLSLDLLKKGCKLGNHVSCDLAKLAKQEIDKQLKKNEKLPQKKR